jgi:hypothetical protein
MNRKDALLMKNPVDCGFTALWLALTLSACSVSDAPQQVAEDQGRADTRSLRHADAVGYEGAAVQKKLDAALDANDRRTETIDRQVDEAEPADNDR